MRFRVGLEFEDRGETLVTYQDIEGVRNLIQYIKKIDRTELIVWIKIDDKFLFILDQPWIEKSWRGLKLFIFGYLKKLVEKHNRKAAGFLYIKKMGIWEK